jgi:hypothetical protein
MSKEYDVSRSEVRQRIESTSPVALAPSGMASVVEDGLGAVRQHGRLRGSAREDARHTAFDADHVALAAHGAFAK